MHQPQIGQRVPHFGALIKAEPADDAIGQADGNEAVFKQARLELGAHQDRHVVQRNALARQPLGLVAHQPGFLRPVPHARHFHALTAGVGGEQRLAQPAAVVRDQRVGSGKNVGRGTVILFQPDHLGTGKIRFEAQDIGHFCAAPAVDRLIIIADAGQVARRPHQRFQPLILGAVGVLIFIHHHIFETALIIGLHIGVLAENGQHVQQQVAEIAGVERLQPFLVTRIHGSTTAVRAIGIGETLAARHIGGELPLVLPSVDQAGELLGRPAFVVDAGFGHHLLQQPQLIIGVENGELRVQPHQFGMATQHLGGKRVEGAEPRQAFGHRPQQKFCAVAHLARRLVGEGDGQHLRWPGQAIEQDVRQPGGERLRLAGAGAGQDQHRAFGRRHRLALRRIQPGQPRRLTGRRIMGHGQGHM